LSRAFTPRFAAPLAGTNTESDRPKEERRITAENKAVKTEKQKEKREINKKGKGNKYIQRIKTNTLPVSGKGSSIPHPNF
jgi:hypothetical protein